MSIYDIKSIKSGLNECLSLIQTTSMRQLASVLSNSITKLDEPMQLAIIGKISSSKSTLVNAILGKDELMTTGQKEVTFNVGWLKYGDPKQGIIVHYKDGREPQKKSHSEFSKLTIESHDKDIENISYIETFDDSEILREINIIDTPGLDANRRIDSQNTLDFLSKVRPDAVIMLFTHAVAESTLDVVRQFNTGTSFSPLNAIGVLSKIDVLWQETIPRNKGALSIAQKMVDNRKKKDQVLRKTLFDLYPISALLFLASTTINEQDIKDIKLGYEENDNEFMASLNSMPRFLNSTIISLSDQRKKELVNKMGLYGISLITQNIKSEIPTDTQTIKELFFRESGAERFMKTLYNHFGTRAKLIKIESIYQHLYQTIQATRASIKEPNSLRLLAQVEQKICDLFSSLVHEHLEYELLNKIYNEHIYLDEDVKNEFLKLCGESGTSAPERLNLPKNTSLSEMSEYVLSRELYWRKEVALEPDPEEREWMNIILKSLSFLRHQIAIMRFQYEQSKAFLFNE